MREFTDDAQTKIDTNLGTEPNILMRIDWDSGVEYYGDKDVTLDDITYDGKILEFSPISSNITVNSSGDIVNATIVLDDLDGTIKDIIDTDVIESTDVAIYQYFENMSDQDLILLMRGKIMGLMQWSEGDRTFTFEIQTYFKDFEVGYVPTEEDITTYGWDKSVEGKPWPMIFGTPKKTEAIQLYGTYKSALAEDWIQLGDASSVIAAVVFLEDYGDLPDTDFYLIVHPKELKTWGVYAKAPMKFYGDVNKSNGLFGVKIAPSGDFGMNLPMFEDIAIEARPLYSPTIIDNQRNVWIDTPYVDLRGQLCLIEYGSAPYSYFVNRCVLQEGKMCVFEKDFGVKLDDGSAETYGRIVEVAPAPRSAWVIYTDELGDGTTCAEYELTNAIDFIGGSWMQSHVAFLADGWIFEAGCICDVLPSENVRYVCDIIGGGTLEAVYFEKNVEGSKYLVEVEEGVSGIFTFTSEGAIGPLTEVSYLQVNDGLTIKQIDAMATGRVFCTINNDTAHKTPTNTSIDRQYSLNNAIDAIRYLIDRYSDVTLNYNSWFDTRQKVSAYTCNFQVNQATRLVELIKDIAWQSRCGISIRNGEYVVKYLSEEPLDTYTVDEENIKYKSLSLEFKNSLEIITRINTSWFDNWYDGERLFIYKNNEDVYGLIEEDKVVYIYDTEAYVQKTIGFWGYRMSESWRNIGLESFLNALRLETFDNIALSLLVLSTNTIRGMVESLGYNSDVKSINANFELASKAGDPDANNEPQEDANYWTGDPRYAVPTVVASTDDPPKTSYVAVSFINENDALANYWKSRKQAYIGCHLWNEHMVTFLNLRDAIEDLHTDYVSYAGAIVPGAYNYPMAGFGYYELGGETQLYELSKVVGRTAADWGEYALYDKQIRIYAVNPSCTRDDIIESVCKLGLAIGTTVNLEIFNGFNLANDGFFATAAYTTFLTWLTANGIAYHENADNAGVWLKSITDYFDTL